MNVEPASITRYAVSPTLESATTSPRARNVTPEDTSTRPDVFVCIAAVVLLAPLAPIVQFRSTVRWKPFGMTTVSPFAGTYPILLQPSPVQFAWEESAPMADSAHVLVEQADPGLFVRVQEPVRRGVEGSRGRGRVAE